MQLPLSEVPVINLARVVGCDKSKKRLHWNWQCGKIVAIQSSPGNFCWVLNVEKKIMHLKKLLSKVLIPV